MSVKIEAEWLHWPETRTLAAAFEEAGQPLRFVGGCVRDSLLGRPPGDVDAATPALPGAVTALLERAGLRAIPTGIGHGTVTALIAGKPFEITTLRRDVACDGRHAEVEYTLRWEEDAARRDFTINAIYADAQGRVYDEAGGLAHLMPLRVVFIGEAARRIQEDALRILRFFRFTAQLGAAEMDAAGLDACGRHAAALAGLSGERIAQEMFKLLAAPMPDVCVLNAMQQAGVLQALQLPPPPAGLARLPPGEPLTRLALWLLAGDATEARAGALRERWRLSGETYKGLRALLRAAKTAMTNAQERDWKRQLRMEGKHVFTQAARIVQALNGNDAAAALAFAERWQPPVFPLTGADLLAAGYEPGPRLGARLKALEAAWEAADYRPTREELLARE